MPRLHRSTWLILSLTLVVGVIANIGGDDLDHTVAFGWPWVYGSSLKSGGQSDNTGLWRPNRIEECSWTSLAANTAILTLVIAAASALWEWRCRQKRSWLQFSLADGFAFLAITCALIACWRYVYHDDFAKARLERSLAATKIRFHTEEDVPADWFWTTLHVPVARRPHRVTSANFQSSRPQDLPADIGSRLVDFGSLRVLCLHDVRPPDSGPIPRLKGLKELQLTGVSVSSNHFPFFSRTSQLQTLLLYGNIDDTGLANLAQNHSLDWLYINGSPDLQLANLSAWPELQYVVLKRVGLSRAGCEAMATLTKLYNLSIDDCDRLTPEDWAILVRAPALDIVEFSGTFDDQGAAALAQSKSIRRIVVKNTQLTDAGIELLTKIPTLQVLRVREANSRLTDRSLEHLIEFEQKPRDPETYVDSEIHLATARPEIVNAARQLKIDVHVERAE